MDMATPFLLIMVMSVTKVRIAMVDITEVCKSGPCQRRPPHRPAPDRPRGAPGSICPALPQRQRSASALPSCVSSTSPSSSVSLGAREKPRQAKQGRRLVSALSVDHEASLLMLPLCLNADAST